MPVRTTRTGDDMNSGSTRPLREMISQSTRNKANDPAPMMGRSLARKKASKSDRRINTSSPT
jgi:hypothetical protein